MGNVLSYSAITTYKSCGRKYQYSYIDRLRPIVASSALLFGSAIDKAIEACLKDASVDEHEVFLQEWSKPKINKREVNLQESLLVRYSLSDFDQSVLEEKDFLFLSQKSPEPVGSDNIVSQFIKYTKLRKDKSISNTQYIWWNLCNWVSLYRKGILILQTHRLEVLPKIKKVLKTQEQINLNNGQGDALIGFTDLIGVWENGETYILDYKTSSVQYSVNAVKESEQLTLYSHALGIKHCGYIVFNKNILKERICEFCSTKVTDNRLKNCKCKGVLSKAKPKVAVQILLDTVDETKEDSVLNDIQNTNVGIQSKNFEKNTKSCYSPFLCPYLSVCIKNGDGSDLEKV